MLYKLELQHLILFELISIENLLQATKHVLGQQKDEVTVYTLGHWFGETVFEKDRVIW